MITIRTIKGVVYVKCGPLPQDELKVFRELSRQFADRNVRALAVELDPENHSAVARTILCEEILEIIL